VLCKRMYLRGNQEFASPGKALVHISEEAWSKWTKADYTLEQWHTACIIHLHDGAPTSKSQCKVPVKTPAGVLNRAGVHAAAGALAGARGGVKGVSADQKTKAENALKRYYAQLGETPPDSLAHHGVKGQRWGFRKEEATSPRDLAKKNVSLKTGAKPDIPNVQDRIRVLSRTDRPQMITPKQGPSIATPKQGAGGRTQQLEEHHGLTRNQKIALFGAATAAAAGYVAYRHYTGNQMPGVDLQKAKQEVQQLENMKLPKSWDVRGLKNGPLSAQKLGDLAGSEINARLLSSDKLVINTSRGYADILPKDGFSNPFAVKQHESVIRVLEDMRDKYPAIRNMNVEVVPMSHVPGMSDSGANMGVMAMRAGEARVMYNDTMSEPTSLIIRANRKFLPGLGAKDYVARHEMGHLLAVAHGELPVSMDLLSGNATPTAWKTWQKAEPLLHKKMLAKHGFTFKELSKLSGYAATQPAEAMAELAGHYFTPEMRSRLTPDQIKRAGEMFDEMGGLTE
jgi:hypothetical protein